MYDVLFLPCRLGVVVLVLGFLKKMNYDVSGYWYLSAFLHLC